jgi:hypothetical protein
VTDKKIGGSCLCDAVTFEVKGPTSKFVHCHCFRCRKATGTAHATNIYVEPSQLIWRSGLDAIERFDLPTARSFARWFCKTCGCPIPRVSRSGKTVVIPSGSLDHPPGDLPRAHIFWESRAPWTRVEDDLPRHASIQNGGSADRIIRPQSGLSSTTKMGRASSLAIFAHEAVVGQRTKPLAR